MKTFDNAGLLAAISQTDDTVVVAFWKGTDLVGAVECSIEDRLLVAKIFDDEHVETSDATIVWTLFHLKED